MVGQQRIILTGALLLLGAVAAHCGPEDAAAAAYLIVTVAERQPETPTLGTVVVFEPVSGLSLNAGAAFVKGEFVPEGYAAGMVVPQDETFTPDRRYMTRFYFGATLTLDIVETVARAAGGANGI